MSGKDSPYLSMNSIDFVAVDFETATNSRMACQLGLVIVKNGIITDKLSFLIQPPGNVYDNNTIAVHHITPDMTENSPTFDQIWDKVQHYFINTTLVAHNAAFDEDVLYKNLSYYGIMPMGIKPFECTCNLYNKTGLHDLCLAFSMPTEGHHNATFDAECCAKFYLNYLNGVEPNPAFLKKQISPKPRVRYTKSDIESMRSNKVQANPNNPLFERTVCVTGTFDMSRKDIQLTLQDMGAIISSTISKKVNFVLLGDEPGPSKILTIDKLIHDGFPIRKLYQKDWERILNGEWDDYYLDKTVKKNLKLTFDHFQKNRLQFIEDRNIIASKELYYGKGFKGKFELFNQITGNLGAAGDLLIYPATNILVISDSTVDNLSKGVIDETIEYIQDYYNNSKAITFEFSFLTESDILDFCKRRCEKCGDMVTLDLYNKYMNSI